MKLGSCIHLDELTLKPSSVLCLGLHFMAYRLGKFLSSVSQKI